MSCSSSTGPRSSSTAYAHQAPTRRSSPRHRPGAGSRRSCSGGRRSHCSSTHVLAKTNNRSVLGSMNDFIFMAEVDQQHERSSDLVALSVRLAHTPCGPLRASTGFPDLELRAVVEEFIGARRAAKTHLRLVEWPTSCVPPSVPSCCRARSRPRNFRGIAPRSPGAEGPQVPPEIASDLRFLSIQPS